MVANVNILYTLDPIFSYESLHLNSLNNKLISKLYMARLYSLVPLSNSKISIIWINISKINHLLTYI